MRKTLVSDKPQNEPKRKMKKKKKNNEIRKHAKDILFTAYTAYGFMIIY